ncbi:MAG: HEAT repeat domain-containing protein [Chloroflexi bacterium]|nr:HEAT repeat domain-containing protein [Chloroflexota bacterium]
MLAARPGRLTADDLAAGLADADARVRAAAVYALGTCPEQWVNLAPTLLQLFADQQADVRRAACQLAGEIRDRQFVRPLVLGLEEEVAARRRASYVTRRDALVSITGVTFPEDPPWQPGEPATSERRWQARAQAAAAWRVWLRRASGSGV